MRMRLLFDTLKIIFLTLMKFLGVSTYFFRCLLVRMHFLQYACHRKIMNDKTTLREKHKAAKKKKKIRDIKFHYS